MSPDQYISDRDEVARALSALDRTAATLLSNLTAIPRLGEIEAAAFSNCRVHGVEGALIIQNLDNDDAPRGAQVSGELAQRAIAGEPAALAQVHRRALAEWN